MPYAAPRAPPLVSRQQYDRIRGSASKRLYGRKWQVARMHWLFAHPLCVACERDGRIKAATDVDHIKPHHGDLQLFWDSENWQGLCKSCHSRKTLNESRGQGAG